MATTSTERSRKHRAANPNSARNEWLRSQYGITAAEYDAMLAEQAGVCRICGRPEVRVRQGKVLRLAVDHCHKTGAVRGLLCIDCNTGLARFKDDPELLKAAIAYLCPGVPGLGSSHE
jgi:hypothetical protein